MELDDLCRGDLSEKSDAAQTSFSLFILWSELHLFSNEALRKESRKLAREILEARKPKQVESDHDDVSSDEGQSIMCDYVFLMT